MDNTPVLLHKGKKGPVYKSPDRERIDEIAHAFACVFSVRRAAGLVKVSHWHLRKWLEKGERDANEDLNSIEARLYFKVAEALSIKAAEYISQLEKRPDNYSCITWLLSQCLGKDYGVNADEHLELSQLYENLLSNYQKLTNKVGLLFDSKLEGVSNEQDSTD